MVCIYIYIYVHICLYIYFYFYFYLVTPPPIIQPSLLVNCSSTVLCLQVLSSMSKNHRYLRKFLHFIYADLSLLCSFLVTPPKTQTRLFHTNTDGLRIYLYFCTYMFIHLFLLLFLFGHTPPPSSSRAFLSTVRLQYYVSKCFLRCPKTIGICESFYTSYMLTSPCCALSWLHHPKPKPGSGSASALMGRNT